MRRYAENTDVPVSKSQGEIIAMAEKRGVKDFFSGIDGGRPFVCFVYRGYPVKLQTPGIHPGCKDPQQEMRRAWRVMVLWVKGQFEAIDNGLLEPFAVFMPYLALRDGRTVHEAIEAEGLPALLAEKFHVGAVAALPAPEDAR